MVSCCSVLCCAALRYAAPQSCTASDYRQAPPLWHKVVQDTDPSMRRLFGVWCAGAIGSVHMLPLYPSTGDRGFAPVTFQNVDPKFGEC